MSDAGDSTHSGHKRSKSAAARALLRGKRDKHKAADVDSSSDDAAAVSSGPGSSASPSQMSLPQKSGSGLHSAKMSTSSPSAARSPAKAGAATAAVPGTAALGVASPEKSAASIEQSVRKFRIVEALRSGDTASISKTLRETAEGGPRSSSSSLATLSAGSLEDTTILHLAIQCAELAVVEYVLSNGAGSIDLNAKDKDGNTALHIAAGQGRTQVVRLLLEQKDINDAIPNYQGRLPVDMAKNPEIFQHLQLARSLFTESKINQVQELIKREDYGLLKEVLEEERVKTVLDINSPEFASETITVQSGGTLLHEAARRRNSKLIQLLLLHGADPFRRDRKGKLPQDVTKDDTTRAMLKRSPAAVAAQRGIQEKAVLGNAAAQASSAGILDPLAGRDGREMKGYLKKWTNYRKGYQLRWFVLEDGVLSYYKHQDDAGSACRGAINMRIARLHMSADEKTKFEIIGKSSVKYTLKANHEVEAKRWFWALNNSIQWTKDQAKEEQRQRAKEAELLRQARGHNSLLASAENLTLAESRTSTQMSRAPSSSKIASQREVAATSTNGSGDYDDDDKDDFATDAGHSRRPSAPVISGDLDDDDDDLPDDMSQQNQPAMGKDAFNITAQSAKLQLDTIADVNSSLMAEAAKNPTTQLGDASVAQALSAYDGAIRTLTDLVGSLLKISKDRDSYWQYRVDREVQRRRMWEESMAKVAHEQEQLEAKYGEAEMKRRLTKRALREVMVGAGSEAMSIDEGHEEESRGEMAKLSEKGKGPDQGIPRRQTALQQIEQMSDSGSSDAEEFFDAVDAGEVSVEELPPVEGANDPKSVVVSGELDISSSFKGYENGIRHRLKIDADNRPKISLWGILKSMIGKDMTKMTLPVTFNEPTSLLYRAGEDMEYADLLDLAADRTDSIERLTYVAAFAASEYASTIGRVAKPFNPLLGETFEYVRPDKNYRFFIEQVSHHPPIGAAWAESPKWTYYGESSVRSKFYGKSFDINPLGTWFLKLRPAEGGKEDIYTWKKVTSSVIGIITGNPTVDNYGTMEIKNWSTGEVCTLEFKPRGWTASSAYQIAGKVVDANGRVCVSLGGRWNSKLYARLTPGYEATPDEVPDSAPLHRGSISQADPKKAFLIWKANPRPTGIPFNLTPFVLTFNHIDDRLRPWLAPTDSRLRPDQRAMEEGEYDRAASEKNRLEEGQRARRRLREDKGLEFAPAWFERARCEVTGEQYWRFSGKYWEQRAKAGKDGDGSAWEGLEPIYEDAPPGVPRRATTMSN